MNVLEISLVWKAIWRQRRSDPQPCFPAQKGFQSGHLHWVGPEGSLVFTGKQESSQWRLRVARVVCPQWCMGSGSLSEIVSRLWCPILQLVYSIVFRLKVLNQCRKSTSNVPFSISEEYMDPRLKQLLKATFFSMYNKSSAFYPISKLKSQWKILQYSLEGRDSR